MTVEIGNLPPAKQKRALTVERFLMWLQDRDIFLAEVDGDKVHVLDLDAHGEEIVEWVTKTEET